MPEASETAPTLVLMPGLHGTSHLFKPLQDVIPPQFKTRLIEYPTDECCNFAELYRRLEEQLHDQTDLVLLGESFSGPLAIRFAADHPEQVRALVLCCSFVGPPVPRLLCYLATPFILLRCPIPSIAIRMFLSGFRAPRELVRQTRRVISLNRPAVLAYRVRLAAWVNAADALKRCRIPILYLAGARDRLVGLRAARRIHRIRPDIPIHPLDAPHLLLQVRPPEAWHEISGFLARFVQVPGSA